MREMILNGELGRLQRINWVITNWFRTQAYYDSGSWRATWAGEGGGVLINQCPHQIDLIQWIVGKLPTKVHGFCKYGQWRDIEVEDEVTAVFEYDDGATGTFITTTGEAPGVNRFEISGTKGMLVAEGENLVFYKNKEDSIEFANKELASFARPECEKIEVETDGKNPQHVGIINNFINALLGKEEFFVDGKEGINGVELMNAIELSGWKGGAPVTIPVDEEEYLRELNIRRANSRHKEVDDNVVVSTIGSFGSKVR
jgi:predicted dehydrogenase